jgi:hypothetical protein
VSQDGEPHRERPLLLTAVGQCFGQPFMPINNSLVVKLPRSGVAIAGTKTRLTGAGCCQPSMMWQMLALSQSRGDSCRARRDSLRRSIRIRSRAAICSDTSRARRSISSAT